MLQKAFQVQKWPVYPRAFFFHFSDENFEQIFWCFLYLAEFQSEVWIAELKKKISENSQKFLHSPLEFFLVDEKNVLEHLNREINQK